MKQDPRLFGIDELERQLAKMKRRHRSENIITVVVLALVFGLVFGSHVYYFIGLVWVFLKG